MPHHDGVCNVTCELWACVDRLDPREPGAGRNCLIKTGFSEHQHYIFFLTRFVLGFAIADYISAVVDLPMRAHYMDLIPI